MFPDKGLAVAGCPNTGGSGAAVVRVCVVADAIIVLVGEGRVASSPRDGLKRDAMTLYHI